MDKKALFRAKVNEKLQKKRIDSPLVRFAIFCSCLGLFCPPAGVEELIGFQLHCV